MKGTKRVVGEAAADRQIKGKIIFKNWAMFTDSKYMHKYICTCVQYQTF